MYQLPGATSASSSSSNIPPFSHQQQPPGATSLLGSYLGHLTNSSSGAASGNAAGATGENNNNWCYDLPSTALPAAAARVPSNTRRTTTATTGDSSDNRQHALGAAPGKSGSSSTMLRTNNTILYIGGEFPRHHGGIYRNSHDAQHIAAAAAARNNDLSSNAPWSQHDGTIAPTSLEALRECMQRQANAPSHATHATSRISSVPSVVTATTNRNRAASQVDVPARNPFATSGNAAGEIVINGSSNTSSSVLFAGDEDAKVSFAEDDRVEQKKIREQKRRSNLTDKFQALSSLLWDIDDAELDPAISLDCLTGTVAPSPDRKKRKISETQRHLSDSAVPSNRIEVMARAIEVITALRNVNRSLKEKGVSNNDYEE
jgi:hypothetical protein